MTHPTIGKINNERTRLFTNSVVVNAKIWCSVVDTFATAKPIRGIQVGADEAVKWIKREMDNG